MGLFSDLLSKTFYQIVDTWLLRMVEYLYKIPMNTIAKQTPQKKSVALLWLLGEQKE